MKSVLRSIDNSLKRPENLAEKDRLEKDFYDKKADKFLSDFDENLFHYDEDEEFPARHRYFYSRLENIEDKKVLDCCCGHGFTSVKCAKRGAIVTGIDISPKMIELAKRNAEFNSVADRIDCKVMSVQDMSFADNTFDYAVGLGALHHLNLELAGKELHRVLKPEGKAIFLEPRIPFRWLILLRSLIPVACMESPGGSQLQDKEILALGERFSASEITYFIFLGKLLRFKSLKKHSGKFEEIDDYLSKKIPILHKLYWAFVVEFTK